jgi:opacity protein-like surface antigen
MSLSQKPQNMKNSKLLALLMLFATSQIVAQNRLDISVGLANPLSDFGSENLNNEDAGGAALGFSAGIKYTHQLSDNGIGLFAGLDFNYNNLTKNVQNDIEESFEDAGILGADYDYYSYLNIPLSTGLNYTYAANEKVALFGNAGVSFNLLNITDFVIESGGTTVTTEFDLANSVGFRIGGGVLFSESISVAIDYYGLGSHDVNGEARTAGLPPEDLDGDIAVNMLTIRLGYSFNL